MNQHSDVKRAIATPAPQPVHRCPNCGHVPTERKPVSYEIRMVREGGKLVEKVNGIRI